MRQRECSKVPLWYCWLAIARASVADPIEDLPPGLRGQLDPERGYAPVAWRAARLAMPNLAF
jgi:hypothetical protein